MILRGISLKKYNTFGLDYKANCLVVLKSEKEAVDFLGNRDLYPEPLLILGEGSNILFTGDFKGTVIIPKNEDINIAEEGEEDVIISAGAGLNWDRFVEWCVNKGYGGIENLSLIPGTVGATPVQNIGAYGAEVKETIHKVRTLSLKDGTQKEFTNAECRFGYRESIFKNELKGKYLVTSVLYRLTTVPALNTEYGSLRDEVSKLGPITLKSVRDAVIGIRRKKLPDPAETGNAGSFFKNPVVNSDLANEFRKDYPQIPCFDDPSGGIKLAAAWLIEQCGWKGRRIGDAGVHDKQSLVLVNYGNASGQDILDLSEKIRRSVNGKFGIDLEREVEVI